MIPLVKVAMPPREQLMPILEEVLYSGMVAEGEYVYKFEKEFGRIFGLPNIVAMSSGTASLHIALLLAGVGVGDEVVTTAMTAEPTNTTILQVGAVPVFADVEPTTGNLDPVSVADRITTRTKAILVVHYAGYPADCVALRALADKHNIWLIEDCAHALGAQTKEGVIGSIGDAAIFSFQAIKHMTTVDGGALSLRNSEHCAEAKRMRWFGMTKGVPRPEVDITRLGYKYNMHNVAAAIGLQQLVQVNKLIDQHKDNGLFFNKSLANIPGLAPAKVLEDSMPSYWLYTLISENSSNVEKILANIGVSAAKLHRPNHLHTLFKPYARPLPELDNFYRRMIHFPCGWWVTDEDRHRMVDALKKG